jgi:hypothetical protein
MMLNGNPPHGAGWRTTLWRIGYTARYLMFKGRSWGIYFAAAILLSSMVSGFSRSNPAEYRILPEYGFHAIALMRKFFRTCENSA